MSKDAELSKKFTRQLAKNLTKQQNSSKISENFLNINHSPNNLLLSQGFRWHMSPQISRVSRDCAENSRFSTKLNENFQEHSPDPAKVQENLANFAENSAFLNKNAKKTVYQIGSLSIEKAKLPKSSKNKENLLSEIKSLNAKFSQILDNEGNFPAVRAELVEKSSNLWENAAKHENFAGKCVKTESFLEKPAQISEKIQEFKSFDGLDFDFQRKALEKTLLRRKLENNCLEREISQRTTQLQQIKQDFAEVSQSFSTKKQELQRISDEIAMISQQKDAFVRQREGFFEEMRQFEEKVAKLAQWERELREKQHFLQAKELENAANLKEIEREISELGLRKREFEENLKNVCDFEAELRVRGEKLEGKEAIFSEKSREMEGKAREIAETQAKCEGDREEIARKTRELDNLREKVARNCKEIEEKEGVLARKERELCKIVEEIKVFSINLKTEKSEQEFRFKSWENALKKKEEELSVKEKLIIEKSNKDEDLELKLLGLKMNEDTFRKKLEMEIRNYQNERLKLVEKEKELAIRERKLNETEKKIRENKGNYKGLVGENAGNKQKNLLKNEIGRIFCGEKKEHRLQKSRSFVVLRSNNMNNSGIGCE